MQHSLEEAEPVAQEWSQEYKWIVDMHFDFSFFYYCHF